MQRQFYTNGIRRSLLTLATTTEKRESGAFDAFARVLAYRLVADRDVDLAIVPWERKNGV